MEAFGDVCVQADAALSNPRVDAFDWELGLRMRLPRSSARYRWYSYPVADQFCATED